MRLQLSGGHDTVARYGDYRIIKFDLPEEPFQKLTIHFNLILKTEQAKGEELSIGPAAPYNIFERIEFASDRIQLRMRPYCLKIIGYPGKYTLDDELWYGHFTLPDIAELKGSKTLTLTCAIPIGRDPLLNPIVVQIRHNRLSRWIRKTFKIRERNFRSTAKLSGEVYCEVEPIESSF